MPKSLANEEEALEKILSRIEEETLDPAKHEADRIVKEAKKQAEEIIQKAESERDLYLKQGRETIAKETELAHSSLRQAGKEGLEALRQKVQSDFFERNFSNLIDQKLEEPAIIEKVVDALLETLKKEGLNTHFTLVLPKIVSSDMLAKIAAKHALSSLQADAKVGDITGGVEVKLHDHHLLLDFSSKSVSELLLPYLRKDLRVLLFGKDVE